jgi:hypothetical protein
MGEKTITAAAMEMNRTVLAALESRGDKNVSARAQSGAAISAILRPWRFAAATVRARSKPVLRRSRNNLPRTKRAPSRRGAAIAAGEYVLDASRSALLSAVPRVRFHGFIKQPLCNILGFLLRRAVKSNGGVTLRGRMGYPPLK